MNSDAYAQVPGPRSSQTPSSKTQLLEAEAEDRPSETMLPPSAATETQRESHDPFVTTLLRLARSSLRLLDAYSLLAFVLLGIAIAAADPSIGVDNGPLRSGYSINYGATILIFLIMGLGLDASDLLAAFADARFSMQLGVLQFYSLLVLPFLTYLLSLLLALSSIKPVLIAGLVVTSCLPTTISSCIVLTSSAGGNEILAIAMAAIGNSIGVVISPLTIVLFSSYGGKGGLGASKIGGIYLDLFIKVIAPLILGVIFKNFPIESVRREVGKYTKVISINPNRLI